jgi:acyl-CoA reductase-like NAD-dependent aldehyde dehydrogenase
MRDGAATMKRVTLELGGKSPPILLNDANLKRRFRQRPPWYF